MAINKKALKNCMATPFRYDEVNEVYEMWDDDDVVECLLHYAMVCGYKPSYMINVFEAQFQEINRQNNRAIAELQILLLSKGWY